MVKYNTCIFSCFTWKITLIDKYTDHYISTFNSVSSVSEISKDSLVRVLGAYLPNLLCDVELGDGKQILY